MYVISSGDVSFGVLAEFGHSEKSNGHCIQIHQEERKLVMGIHAFDYGVMKKQVHS